MATRTLASNRGQRGHEQPMLRGQNPSGQRLGIVAGPHRNM